MSSKTCAIGLYKYFSGDIGAEDFRKFYEQSNSIFKNLGIQPTYFAVEGKGYRGDLKKYKGSVHSKVVKSGFSDINVMSIVANPEGSEAPGYDSYASISLGYVKELNELILSFCVDDRFLEFGSTIFENILEMLLSLVTL